MVAKPPGAAAFVVRPKRRVVERTFAWLRKRRRLGEDDERSSASPEAPIRLAMTGLVLRRLRPAP